MSVMFLKQLTLHRESLEAKINAASGTSIDSEIAEAKKYLSATKDPRFKAMLAKRIEKLTQQKTTKQDVGDLKKKFAAVDGLYQMVKDDPSYNRTRKRKAPKSK